MHPIEWEVSGTPTTVIGRQDGSPGHDLYLVQGARISGEALAIANGGSNSVRVFDLNGTIVRELGGSGDGPGEFRLMISFDHWGSDSLLVWDAGLRRITIMEMLGSGTRTFSLDMDRTRVLNDGFRPHHASSDGGYITVVFAGPEDYPRGASRRAMALLTLNGAGEVIGIVNDLPGMEMYNVEGLVMTLPLGRRFFAAMADSSIYVGDGSSATLMKYSPDGILLGSFQLPIQRTLAGPEDHVRARAAYLGLMDPRMDTAEIGRRWDRMPEVDSLPAFSDIGSSGRCLWLKESRADSASTWLIVDPRERLATRVRLPREAKLMDVGKQVVVVLQEDEVGRQIVAIARVSPTATVSAETPISC